MQAMICDRCGRFIVKDDETKEYKGMTLMAFPSEDCYLESIKLKKDICDDCAKDFQKWLNDDSALVKEFNESLNALKRLKEARNA